MLNEKEQAVKTQWVDALRSGDYPQTRGRLQRAEGDPDKHNLGCGFCCLGVLQKVGYGDVERHPDGLAKLRVSQDFLTDHPELRWVAHNDGQLIEMNDKQGASFADIADYIEKNWV